MNEHRDKDAKLEAPRSVHTSSLEQVLQGLGISLVVSTYQAGQVILVRHDGRAVNTRFRAYDQAMGLAVDEDRLAIGSRRAIWTLKDMPGVARKLDPPGKHDACYLPRRMHVTGDIDVHEMAYDAQHELWLINTRFGCLCTLDSDHSFVPRWTPPFLSALVPEDRCHLNGLAMRDGRPRYVTALGETDRAGAWRSNKADGGILMEVDSDRVLLRGLSMPHSPRWYQDRLWLLESGRGSLTWIDLERGTKTDVARLPGFTRGLAFCGPLAFIGLSQVRETAHFDGIPMTRDGVERSCGIWVVDIRSGETVAFLRFETIVQEIFAVQVLPHSRFPEILDLGDERLSLSFTLPDESIVPIALTNPDRRESEPSRVSGRPPTAGSQDEARSRVSRGLALLEQGDIEQGFTELAWCRHLSERLPSGCSQPELSPGDLTGKRLLVLAEPSESDTIQFLRFLPKLADRAGHVTLMAPDRMLGLLRTAAGLHELRPSGKVEPREFDLCLPLMSLPGLLGVGREEIGADLPYLAPPRDRTPLPPPEPGAAIAVGLVWADEAHGAIPIELLRSLLDLPDLTFYSLQSGVHAAEVAALRGTARSLHDLSGAMDDWATRASFLGQLDLVVGVDSATVHLAGALGKPAWVLLGPRPHWCWGKDGEVGPWYPTLRLVRQDAEAGLPGQIMQVRKALERAARAARHR